MAAKRSFILPVYLYKIAETKTGKVLTYKNQNNEEVPQSGLRLLLLKDTSSLLAQLLSNYRELPQGDTLDKHDIVIERVDIGGEAVNASYTVIVRTASPFQLPDGIDIPAQSPEAILEQMLEKNPPVLIDEPGTPPPAQAQNGAVKAAPDF